VSEEHGSVKPVIVLSNPISTLVDVKIRSKSMTANGSK